MENENRQSPPVDTGGVGPRSNRHLWRSAAWLVLTVGIALRLTFFAVSVTQVPPAMDECITALQSKGMVEAGDTVAARAKRHPEPVLGRFPLLFMAQPYLFPLESYLNVPFVGWLPRNAFGIRLMPTLLGVLALMLSLLTIRAWGAWRDVWPGALLLLLPSAYLLMIQAGYAPPGYASFLFLSALVLYLAQRYRDAPQGAPLWAIVLGFCAGLAVGAQTLALPMLLVATAMVLFGRPWRTALVCLPLFLTGVFVGWLPYLAAKVIYPGAHQAVSGVRTVTESLARLWSLVLNYSLPAAMGFRCCRFPDSDSMIEIVPGIGRIFPYVWLAIAVPAALYSMWRIVYELRHKRRLALKTSDLFVGIAWLGILLFAASSRAFSGSFRYLLGVVWAFPFLVVHLYRGAGRRVRWALGIMTIAVALLNAATSAALIREWMTPGFAAREPRIYDLRPAIAYLRERAITRCYANYFDTYRINYMTDEAILCSQHYNFRFPWWPLPYKDIVDAATNVAYVLGPAYRFPPSEFEQGLAAMDVGYTKTVCGAAAVYTDFVDRRSGTEFLVPSSMVTAQTSCRPEDAHLAVDDDLTKRWWSRQTQVPGMWVSLTLSEPLSIARVAMYYNSYHHDHAQTMNVLVRQGTNWTAVATNVAWELDHFEMRNGHPVYGNVVHSMRFGPVLTDAVRVEIHAPLAGRDWCFDEVRLYATEAVDASVAK